MALTDADRIAQQELSEQEMKNKLINSKNFLDYTGLTYEDILGAVNRKLSSDSTFDNFRESAIAQMVVEIFAGIADLNNYYIERTAEEGFWDTAKLKSSLILLSRHLAYDIKRPIPSQTRIKVTITGNFSSAIYSVGNVIQIPQYSNFDIDGENFLILKQFNYSLTSDDLDKGDSYSKDIIYNEVSEGEDSNIRILQGERKVIKVSGELNSNVNQVFQKYKINDKTFSNLYGSQDLVGPVTEIGIGNSIYTAFPNGVSDWTIDRKTLLNPESIETYDFTSNTNLAKKVCLIRTSLDEGVDVLFGDDKYASKGLKQTTDNLYVKYLSTNGAKSNRNGVIGKNATILSSITLRAVNITDKVKFTLLSNITMGSDIESNDSIRVSAPAIFRTLDRLVTKQDYIDFLEALSSPIDVRNAIAWGEQEEIRDSKLYYGSHNVAIKKLFNVILFSVVGSLYNIRTDLSEFSVKTNLSDENAVLDSDFKEDEIRSQSYFNIFTINGDDGGNVVEEVMNQNIASQGDDELVKYQIINGGGERSTNYYDWKTYRSTDPSNPTIIYYTDIEGVTSFNADGVSAVNIVVSANLVNSFDALATSITNDINSKHIFPSDFICYWDDTVNNFSFKLSMTSGSKYIVDMFDGGGVSSEVSLGLWRGSGIYNIISYTNDNISYSEKITEVINVLNSRSMITSKAVYISPIIQNFELTGNVYIDSLVDKDTIKTKIKNKIYSWLDDKSDFGTEIYLSNIIELIENFPTVKRADIKINPVSCARIDGVPNFISGLNSDFSINYSLTDEEKNRSVYWQAYTEYGAEQAYQISRIFEDEVRNFITNELDNLSNFKENVTVDSVYYVGVIYNNDRFNNKVNERLFFSNLAKPIYERLRLLSVDYYQSSLFYVAISNIHKDLLYPIRYNMLDSQGNIAKEYETFTVANKNLRKFIRGGYSLGNEIVKLNLNFQVTYKR
jgi:uncharacterized phage protein gp47/JayE